MTLCDRFAPLTRGEASGFFASGGLVFEIFPIGKIFDVSDSEKMADGKPTPRSPAASRPSHGPLVRGPRQ
jgi:hypothetical protein